MAASIFIVTLQDFLTRTLISRNVNTDKLKTEISSTQEKYGRKILCEDFYTEVLNVVAGTASSAVINTLLPYIRDFLVYKTYARYLVSSPVSMTPAGARVQVDPNSNPASDKQYGEMIAQAKNDANYYQDRLVNFLELNEDNYPTWKNSICNCGDKRVKTLNKLSLVGNVRRDTPITWT